MRSMTKALWCGVWLAVAAAAGCEGGGRSRTGPESFRPEELSGNEAVIYIFREAKGLGAPTYQLHVDQQDLGELRSGQYRSVVVTPGEHYVRVSSKGEAAREVVVGPGESAYVMVTNSRFQKRRPEVEVLGTDQGRRLISGSVASKN